MNQDLNSMLIFDFIFVLDFIIYLYWMDGTIKKALIKRILDLKKHINL